MENTERVTARPTLNPYLLAFFGANGIKAGESYRPYEYILWIDKMHSEFRSDTPGRPVGIYNGGEYKAFIAFLEGKIHTDLPGLFMDGFPHEPAHTWSDGSQLLTKSEERCRKVADRFEAWGHSAVTGYYNPAEDRRNGETDRFTGYYYVGCC